MLHLSASCQYYLYPHPVNMRKSFDGLSGIVQNELKADPLSSAVFIFLNRRRNQVKLLLWEGDGFSLYHKRLEKGTYELPAGRPQWQAVRKRFEGHSLEESRRHSSPEVLPAKCGVQRSLRLRLRRLVA